MTAGSRPLSSSGQSSSFGNMDLSTVEAAATRIAPYIVRTPAHRWSGSVADQLFGETAEVWVKLELFQITGSFKARGALNAALLTSPDRRTNGFTTFSSGNHAAAVAYAAKMLGTTAKVVMLQSANPARVQNCRRFGGEVMLAPDGKAAIEMVAQIEASEGRVMIHPYEGAHISAGAASIALELHHQVPELDSVILAIGGGGLCSGVGSAMKLLQPDCAVWAVEPEGADTMYRSFLSGKPEVLTAVNTIADSLAPPQTLPYSLSLCRASIDDLRLVSDQEIRLAMQTLYSELKLAVEPGGAAALAGALGPFRQPLAGKRIAIIVCGSNIDVTTLKSHLDHVSRP